MRLRLLAAGGIGLFMLSATAVAASQVSSNSENLVRHSTPAPYVVPPSPVASAEAPRTAGEHTGSALDASWVRRVAAASGVPEPALRAYADAQLRTPRGCALTWTTLAGLGYVESIHGTLDSRALGPDGRSTPPIIGPALNGQGEVQAIAATPQGTAWHGDPQWEHAVGPLQFLPSTWARWGIDADGDGVADPHDLDDAALAAARYLCADGYDLTEPAGWAAAVYAYNHAQSYVDQVYAASNTYAQRAADG